MRKVAVFTGTRAEYGLLYWLINDVKCDANLALQLIVSGSHLSAEFGNTFRQIEEDGFTIDAKVEMLLSSDTAVGVVKSLGLAVIGYADALSRLQPDIIVILGDRYEALAIAQAALFMHVPVVHLHGGEITEGAYDDAVRHAITKLSLIHCVSNEAYRLRVIQLGETPDRVKNVGAIGLDHLTRSTLMTVEQLSVSLNFELKRPYFVVSYHPVTWENESPVESFQALLKALDEFQEHQVIITYPNADEGGRQIIPLLEAYAARQRNRVFAIPSLGHIRYLSAIKNAAAVIGNSSSGIVEVPAVSVPTVNIGTRQKGRLAAKSVLHCEDNFTSIKAAIETAINHDYFPEGVQVDNPHGHGDTSPKIIDLLKSMPLNGMKIFYDIPLEGYGI